MTTTAPKPSLSFWQIWNMSFGFLGIQYGFGLQQANMSPIFRYLGADESSLPVLWLAGPITGLVIQPIIGAMSDKTWTRYGRRRPYFLIGALVGSIAVLLMPYSPVLWVAVSLFWILDAAMNTAMEPYRALVGDKLNDNQRTVGFAVQSFMIAGGQILSGLMPLFLGLVGISAVALGHGVPDIVKYSFVIGVAAMLVTVLWTFYTTEEYPPENMAEFRKMQAENGGLWNAFKEIANAVREMPDAIRKLWWVKLATWYGMPLMWQYLGLSIARHCFNAPTPDSPGFEAASQWGGVALTVMNITTVVMSILIPMVVRKMGTKQTYAVFLTIGGVGFLAMLFTQNINLVLACMTLVGVAWSAIITMPFIIATAAVPAERIGVYMGLLNAFICIPQIINMVTVGSFYDSLLGGDPRNALALLGVCLLIGAFACIFLKVDGRVQSSPLVSGGH
ncbi:MAG: MFS transporter [Bacteroidetes Order II. Incertae sedis bacterium]|nr:MFS transporter [Bacteroidetes Order II. bacterium]